MPVNVYYEDVNVGDDIPRWSRKTDGANWLRYAAVSDEFPPFAYDDDAGRAAGNDKGVYGIGNLRYAYVLNALRDWIGDEADIREVGCEFRIRNQKGDTLTVTGTVVEKAVEEGENRVTLVCNVVNDEGQSTCPAHAVVVLPNRT